MLVKDAISALQKLHPDMDLMIEANDGDLPLGISAIKQNIWYEDDGKEIPIGLVFIFR